MNEGRKKNGLPWFKLFPTGLKPFERRASAEAIKEGLFAAIQYFETCGEEPEIKGEVAGMVYEAFRMGIDESLAQREKQSAGGKKSATARKKNER